MSLSELSIDVPGDKKTFHEDYLVRTSKHEKHLALALKRT